MSTELAPDVRARVRSQGAFPRRPGAPPRPAPGAVRPVQRFGSTRVGARHHWVLWSVLVLLALIALVALVVL